ncbi:MAG: serine acetyltransferase [Planctomycetota bacterium]
MSATVGDPGRERWARGEYAPGKRLLAAIRAYQSARGPLAPLARRIAVLRHRFWSAVTGCDVPIDSRIGVGLVLPHPLGIVLHPDAEVGPNCLLFQGVTLGTREGRDGAPRLGGHVDVGAGAKILGPVVVGDHAKIGANAVVLHDVPPHGVAVGVPAKVIAVAEEAA